MPNVRNLNITLVRSYLKVRVDPVYHCDFRYTDGIIYYKKGCQSFEFTDNQKFVGKKGDIVYLPYGGEYVNHVVIPETEYYQIDLHIKSGDKIIPLFSRPFVMRNVDTSKYDQLFFQIHHQNVALNTDQDFSLFANLCELINYMRLQSCSADNLLLSKIENSVDYINKYYMRNTPIAEIAGMSATCVTNLERIFKQCFHVTPSKYRNIVRINKAKQLLLSGLTIEETAAQVGFFDAFHFSKTFKSIVGITPKEYIIHELVNPYKTNAASKKPPNCF